MPSPFTIRTAVPDPITPRWYFGLKATVFTPVDTTDATGRSSTPFSSLDAGVEGVYKDQSGNELASVTVLGYSSTGSSLYRFGAYDGSEQSGAYYVGLAHNDLYYMVLGRAKGIPTPDPYLGVEPFVFGKVEGGPFNTNSIVDRSGSFPETVFDIDWGNDYASPGPWIQMPFPTKAPKWDGGNSVFFPISRITSLDPNGFNTKLLGVVYNGSTATMVCAGETLDGSYNRITSIDASCPADSNLDYSSMMVTLDSAENSVRALNIYRLKPAYSSIGVVGSSDSTIYSPHLTIGGSVVDVSDWNIAPYRRGYIVTDPAMVYTDTYIVNREWTFYQPVSFFATDELSCTALSSDFMINSGLKMDHNNVWFLTGQTTAPPRGGSSPTDIIFTDAGPSSYVCPSGDEPPVDYNASRGGFPGEARPAAVEPRIYNPKNRSWTFTQDGHDFFVLRLGEEETLVYDKLAQQWYNWNSGELDFWRLHIGCHWPYLPKSSTGSHTTVVAGDDTYGTIWALDPDKAFDDEPDFSVSNSEKPFVRVATAQTVLKGRKTLPCYEMYLGANVGTSVNSEPITLEYSDDGGTTYISAGTLNTVPGDRTREMVWRSLGSIPYPGRLFKLTNFGALSRLDGLYMNEDMGE